MRAWVVREPRKTLATVTALVTVGFLFDELIQTEEARLECRVEEVARGQGMRRGPSKAGLSYGKRSALRILSRWLQWRQNLPVSGTQE